MDNIKDILDQVKTDLEDDIPALLSAASLPAFDRFVVGQSRNPQEMALCVYKDEFRGDPGESRLSLMIQAQLAGVSYEQGIEIEDVLLEYLLEYDPAELGMTVLESVSSDTWPMERTQGVFIFITMVFTEPLDSCD